MKPLAPHLFLLAVVVCTASPAAAQATDETFSAEERITIVDLTVGLGPPGSKARSVDASDLRVQAEGVELPVVGVSGGEPWDIRIWIDPVTASRESIRWAADLLVSLAQGLTDLGTVSVIVADPDPHRRLEPTRDPRRVTTALADLSLLPSGRDELRALRHEALEAGTPEVAARAADAEVDLVLARNDTLLHWLSEKPGSSARRVLLLVSEGFDLKPADFYRRLGIEVPPDAGVLGQDASHVADVLAGYGWTTLVVTPAPEASLRPKTARIGKWLFSNRGIWYQEQKKPLRAHAYLELAEVLLEQDALPDAEDAFRRALRHFADDPKTAREQSRSLVGLAAVHRRSGDLRRAREALVAAAELDASRATALASVAAELHARLEPLHKIATATAGHVSMDESDLREALLDLGRRLQVTVQVSGPLRGELIPIDVTHRHGKQVRVASQIRSGTPPRIVEARLRRLLDGSAIDGSMTVLLTFEETSSPHAQVSFPALSHPRVSWALGGPEAGHRFLHRGPALTGAGSLSALDLPDSASSWIAVHVEDLESGLWGVAAAETGRTTE